MRYQLSSRRSSTILGVYEAVSVLGAAHQYAREYFGVDFHTAVAEQKIDQHDIVVTMIATREAA